MQQGHLYSDVAQTPIQPFYVVIKMEVGSGAGYVRLGHLALCSTVTDTLAL